MIQSPWKMVLPPSECATDRSQHSILPDLCWQPSTHMLNLQQSCSRGHSRAITAFRVSRSSSNWHSNMLFHIQTWISHWKCSPTVDPKGTLQSLGYSDYFHGPDNNVLYYTLVKAGDTTQYKWSLSSHIFCISSHTTTDLSLGIQPISELKISLKFRSLALWFLSKTIVSEWFYTYTLSPC